MSNHVLRRVAIAPIRIYQQVISPLLPDACIYYPTCSQYAVQAIEKHGVLRLLACREAHRSLQSPARRRL